MLKGKAWKYGDDVDTDVIIPARRLTSSDPEVLKQHCMEDLDPEFASRVASGDVIVAGRNFGCGSSREHAPLAIKGAGVSAVIAESFARIFFRNAFNIGLPILESAEAAGSIERGDELEVDLESGLIRNLTKAAEYRARPLPAFMRELIADGGLVGHVRRLVAEGRLESSEETGPDGEEQAEEKREPGARMRELEEEGEPGGKSAPWVEEEQEGGREESLDDQLEREEREEEEEEEEKEEKEEEENE